MALIPITGYPSSWRAPFTAGEILLGQGPSNAAAGQRSVCFVGPKTTAGTATVSTLYQVGNEKEARDYAGVGSPLHRMVRQFLLSNTRAKVYILPYAATSGGSPATATGTIVVTASPTATGIFKVWVCGELMSVQFTTSSTATTIGDDIAAQINARDWLPCTAANVTGTVTLTAKIAGASQGDGTVGVIRYRVEIDAGKGVTATVSGAALGLGTGTAGADGTTTESANLTTALAAMTAVRHYYVGVSVWAATPLAAVKSHVTAKSEPSPGLRSMGVSAYTHTLAACSTIAVGLNHERHLIAWQKNSDWDTAALVGQMVAILQKREALEPDAGAQNFDGYAGADWLCPRAYAESDWPTETDCNDAAVDGITAIKSTLTGSNVSMMLSTRSKNAAGTLDDFRATERHRLSCMDWLLDTILLRFRQQYANFMLRDDRYNADGTVNQSTPPKARVLTPSLAKPFFSKILTDFEDTLLQDADGWKDGLRCVIDPQNVSRLEVGLSGRSMDLLHQTSVRIAETTPG